MTIRLAPVLTLTDRPIVTHESDGVLDAGAVEQAVITAEGVCPHQRLVQLLDGGSIPMDPSQHRVDHHVLHRLQLAMLSLPQVHAQAALCDRGTCKKGRMSNAMLSAQPAVHVVGHQKA